MSTPAETQLALHEQRITAIEKYSSRVENKLDILIEKIDSRFIARTEYRKDVEDQTAINISVKKELDQIRDTMVTTKDMKTYQRSQFWQKVMTFAGGICMSAITWIILFELSKALKH